MQKRIYLSPPHMTGNEMKYIQEAFDTNWIAPLGPNVEGFEREISMYVGTKGATALISGTAAIHLALKYLGVKQGDYVFCTSLTFSGTCNPIVYENAIPVFIDSERESLNMSPIALEKAFDSFKKRGIMPKAVIIVNLYGQSADYDSLLSICDSFDVPVIEDAAESLGAKYKGRKTGTFGKIGILSFNGNKIITTSGGGMAVSDDLECLKKMKFWATQARENEIHYEHKEIGYNYRMSNIVAGIGRGQLLAIDEKVKKKKEIFYRYKEAFSSIEAIEMMPIAEYGEPNYWLTIIKLNNKTNLKPKDIITELEKQNIEARPLWKPMHLQPVFSGCEFFKDNEDVAGEMFLKGLCLPSGTSITEDEQQFVISSVKSLF